MSTTPQHSTAIRPYPALPPVTITGHAFYYFSRSIHLQLKSLEKKFGAREKSPVPSIRKIWKPPPRKPR